VTPKELTLSIPDELDYQLVYRQVRTEPLGVEEREDLEFVFLAGPREALGFLRTLLREYGPARVMKTLLKLCTGKRMFYFVLKDGRISRSGWCWVSICRPYKISRGEVVVGAGFTTPEFRRQGIATYGIKRAINRMLADGYSVFYIDTSRDNLAAQRVIARCEFGAPIATYIR
jgi:RimJ/RimL family protein N-acetyltransferase